MAQRYVIWLKFDGSRFSGFARAGGNGFGVIDFLSGILNHVLKPRGFKGVYLSPGSRTDSGVHVLRGPVAIHTYQSNYLIDENEETKKEILQEINSTLKNINMNSAMEVLDLHRVSPGFSVRKHIEYRRYVYRIRVPHSREIHDYCDLYPTMHCFAERNHSWTLQPDFNFHRAQEACAMMEGIRNMASFYKVPTNRQKLLSFNDKRTDRQLLVVRMTGGKPLSNIPDPLFNYYEFEVISRSFLREQIRRMLNVVTSYASYRVDKDRIRQLFDYPHPDSFYNLGFRPSPPHGLYLADCVYDPKQFTDPNPYMEHGWDNPTESKNSEEQSTQSDTFVENKSSE